MPRARKNSRHTLAPGDVLSARDMLDMLEGTGSDGGPTCTIDVKTFQDTFGAPRSSGSSTTRKKRRETADPSMLKDLLSSCVLSDEEEAEDEAVAPPESPLPRRSPRVASKNRRMTCDPRLLKKLVLNHSGEVPIPETIRESSGGSARKSSGSARKSSMSGSAQATVDVSAFQRAFGSPEPAAEEEEAAAAAAAPAEEAPAALNPPWSEEEEVSEEEEDIGPVKGRASIAWTFDETRATMKELRRQLEIEKEVSQDAERERDELATELAAIKLEAQARAEIVGALETQREAATRRASVAEGRASRADAEHSRLSLLQLASDAAAEAREADAQRAVAAVEADADLRVQDAERAAAAAKRDAADAAHECALLQETIDTLRARVAELEKVKITSSFAAKIRKVVEERDALLAEKHKYNKDSDKENAFNRAEAAPATDAAGECRQS